MITTPTIINLQLNELEQILLEYYKEIIKVGNLTIDSEVRDGIFEEKEVEFKINSMIELSNNTVIDKKYIFEEKDIKKAINLYLNKYDYEMKSLVYNFYEFTDELLSVDIVVTKKKENKKHSGGKNMEQKETLVIYKEELKSILAKHYFWTDYQTKEECFVSTKLEIRYANEKNNKIQFILKNEKKIDSFKEPIKKQFVITKAEVINIINENLFKEGYEIEDFDYNISYGLNGSKNDINFISLNLRKKTPKTLKKIRRKKNV